MFMNYPAGPIDWNLALPLRFEVSHDTATTPDITDDSSTESTHSGELIEWDEATFCDLQTHKLENQRLQRRVQELEKQLDVFHDSSTAAAATHHSAESSWRLESSLHSGPSSWYSELAAFNQLVAAQGLDPDISAPIKAMFVRELARRRKAEIEMLCLRQKRELAMEECWAAQKAVEELKKSRLGVSAAAPGEMDSEERIFPRQEEESTLGLSMDRGYVGIEPQAYRDRHGFRSEMSEWPELRSHPSFVPQARQRGNRAEYSGW